MSKKTKTICTAAALIVLALLIVMSENSGSMLRSVLQYAAIYALAAVSMNLLNGFTGLFSLGTAGFMALGAYAYAEVSFQLLYERFPQSPVLLLQSSHSLILIPEDL